MMLNVQIHRLLACGLWVTGNELRGAGKRAEHIEKFGIRNAEFGKKEFGMRKSEKGKAHGAR